MYVTNYKPTFNRGAFKDINTEHLIASLATPANEEQISDMHTVGKTSGKNRQRIFVPYFPKQVAEDASLEIKNQNDFANQSNQELKQLISDTDKNFALNLDPRMSVIQAQNIDAKPTNPQVWDQSFLSDNMHILNQSEINETMVIDSGIVKTQDHTMLNVSQVSAFGAANSA